MGAWGKGPLQNDAACEVLDAFFGDLFGEDKVQVLRAAFRYVDDYDSARAACYILQLLGDPRTWPMGREAELRELLDLGIERLTRIVRPPDEDFLGLWGPGRREVIDAVEREIAGLKAKRERLD
jgi:hypothetical protein